MQGKLSFFLDRGGYGRYVDLFVLNEFGDKRARMMPVAFVDVPEGEEASCEPALRMKPEDAQRLMDELWAVGLRPTQGKQSEGQFTAQGRHLEDMRAMVQHLTKAPLPNGGAR